MPTVMPSRPASASTSRWKPRESPSGTSPDSGYPRPPAQAEGKQCVDVPDEEDEAKDQGPAAGVGVRAARAYAAENDEDRPDPEDQGVDDSRDSGPVLAHQDADSRNQLDDPQHDDDDPEPGNELSDSVAELGEAGRARSGLRQAAGDQDETADRPPEEPEEQDDDARDLGQPANGTEGGRGR